MMEDVFHIYSFGDKTPDLFTTEKDFKEGMNLVAVLAYIIHIRILAFGFEDTHFHLLVSGSDADIVKFRRQVQRLIRRKHGNAFELDMEKVTSNDYLLRVGAYVICQATKDGKRILPVDYRWSSAALYFRTVKKDLLWQSDSQGNKFPVNKMSEIGKRCQRRIFHTKAPLPDDWEVCNDLILPSSYVDISAFEMIYRTHNAFRTFCGSGRNADEAILNSMSEQHGIALEESEAREVTSKVTQSQFGFADVRKMTTDQRILVARELRRKYRMSYAQIARRVHLPEAEVRKFI